MIITFVLLGFLANAQKSKEDEKSTLFGMQIKPIIPSNLFNAGAQSVTEDRLTVGFTPKLGYSFGMDIRANFGKYFAFETGINYAWRKYDLSIDYKNGEFVSNSDFRIVGYEVPALGLLYIRLSKNIYMNTAFGASLDFFPTNIRTYDGFFDHYSIRQRWVQMALLANIGYELRTKEKGIFYIGGSYHRPFTPLYTTRVRYYEDQFILGEVITELSGNYITIDFRYFFPEGKEKE